ncbi:MAG: histidine kinase [Saprospiraceae bacterium]|nr:histidine kinase [Saprospiraceae bacterium]
MLRVRIIGIIICSLIHLLLMGQVDIADISQISREDGLSDRRVKKIIKDLHGYIWIATRNGLNRYDGISVTAFDHKPGSENRINAKDIRNLCAGRDGSVIIQYESNRRFLDILTPRSSAAQRLFLNEENGVVGESEVEEIYMNDRTGVIALLVEQDSQLFIQQLVNQAHFDTLEIQRGFVARPSSTFAFTQVNDGSFWINDSNFGLFQVNPSGQIQSSITYDTLSLTSSVGLARIMHQDEQGRFWLTFRNSTGIWEYNEAAELFTPFVGLAEDESYQALWEDLGGNVLIISRQLDRAKNLFLIGSDDQVVDYNRLLSVDRMIYDIYSDDFEKLLFLGTQSGIKKVNQYKKRVRRYLASVESPGSESYLRGITSTINGDIIFSNAFSDWYKLDLSRDTVVELAQDLDDSEALFCDCAKNLISSPDGTVWGTRYSDLRRAELIGYNDRDTVWEYFAFTNKIQSIAMGRDGNIWLVSGDLGEESMLSHFNIKTNNFHHYFNKDASNPLAGYQTTYLFESSDSTKWIGTTNGLFAIDVKTGTHRLFQHDESDFNQLSGNYILVISEDGNGRIWIGTDGAGVNIFDPEQEDFEYYDTRDGLPADNVCGIVEDNNGNTWLSTYNGLTHFDVQLKSFRTFGVQDGISDSEFNRYSFFKDTNRIFYFGGVNGLNVFNSNELLERDLDVPILLSELSFYDKIEGAIVEQRINLQNIDRVILPASNRYFQCVFALSDYTYPNLNQYQYKMEGLDIDWNNLGTVNELRFNNLQAGDYTLKIRGADRNGNVSKQELSLGISVLDYFYRQTWFLILAFCLLLMTIYLFHRIRLQQAIKMERLRTKISSDLHDDVGGLLSGLAMQTELLEYTAKEKDKPKLKRISEMSRNAMAQMRDVIWATDARKDQFEDLLVRMKEHAAEILFPKGISCYFKVHNINVERRIAVQIRQNLYLIFKEAVTNIAKHSNASRADVVLSRDGSRFEMRIFDNGKPSQSVETSSSLNGSGLANMEMRARNINANLKIDQEDGFSISIKMRAFA